MFKRIPASGLIEDRLKYLRRKNDVKSRSKTALPIPVDLIGWSSWFYIFFLNIWLIFLYFSKCTVTEQDHEKKSWLANSNSPTSQVANYMSDTYNLRTMELKNSKNLLETINEWPRLLDTSGMVCFFVNKNL